MKMLTVASLMFAAAFAPAAVAAKPEAAAVPVVADAWISEAPPVARNNAAFITLTNGSGKDALLAVESSVSAAVELHTMSMAGGIMRMQRLPLINLAPAETLRMAPGGRHIMLINMKQPLKAGDRVPLTLVFRKAGRMTVEAEVRPLVVNDESDHAGHESHDHSHDHSQGHSHHH